MVERMKKELDIKKIDIKEETFTVEEICNVYVQEEDGKMETLEIKGKIFKNLLLVTCYLCSSLQKTVVSP